MFLAKWKLISVVVLVSGAIAAGAAGVLAQQGDRPDPGTGPRPAADQPDRPLPTGSRQAAGAGSVSVSVPVPAYIKQSRTMIITRLEEELEEAKARLERTRRKARSADDPVVVRARKTVQDLQDLLDRIDRVLVDAVDAYPTMFDFSGEPPDEAELTRARDRADWARKMFDKGYISQWQLDRELQHYFEVLKSRRTPSADRQPEQGGQKGNDPTQPQYPQRQQGQGPGQGQQGQAKSEAQGQSQGESQGQSQGRGQNQPAGQRQDLPDKGQDKRPTGGGPTDARPAQPGSQP
jgi:hypothetical protein